MRSRNFRLRRAIVAPLCVSFLLASLPASAGAQMRNDNNGSKITVEIGKPNVWSLAQAHYLLAVMRHTNRGLKSPLPTEAELNPNSINGNRLELLRQMLGVEAQFNSVTGTQNRLALEKFNSDFGRRDAVRTRLDQKRDTLFTLIGDISLLNSRLTQTKAEGPFEGEREEERQALLKELQNSLDTRTAQKAAVDAEIAALSAEATSLNTAVAAPTLTSPLAAATPPALQEFSTAMGDLLKKTANSFTSPSLDSSIVLDNHVQMQYEIIAKQLTLLRDELGPDERLLFLELPTSIYTVPGKDNDYVVQVEWEVKRYFGETGGELRRQRGGQRRRGVERGGPPDPERASPAGTHFRASRYVTAQQDVPRQQETREPQDEERVGAQGEGRDPGDAENNQEPVTLKSILETKAPAPRHTRLAVPEGLSEKERQEYIENMNKEAEREREFYERETAERRYDIAERVGRRKELAWIDVRRETAHSQFRIIDLIPRQSELNVNDAIGSTKNWNFAGALNFLFGFGARVGFQRQREKFEQFMQQEVFASAHGKGLSRFGWTFGPHPGTTRLNPGLRTTYAVLVVPRDALAVELAATGKVFHRKKSPDYDGEKVKTFAPAGDGTFTILVPQEATERFRVTGISYTPAPVGGRVTALLTGEHFSPQIGVFVNGTPLSRAVSITKHESDAVSGVRATSGIQGEYEFLSSENIVMNFSMGTDYSGTPLITLVTPEKTSAINYFALQLNHRGPRTFRLINDGERYPMFLEAFDVTKMDQLRPEGSYYSAELHGSGLERYGQVWVNGEPVTSATLLSSRRYRIVFPKSLIDGKAEAKVRYTQHSTRGIQERTIVFEHTVPGEFEVVEIAPGKGPVKAELALLLALAEGGDIADVRVVGETGDLIGQPTDQGGGKFLLRLSARQNPLQLSVPKAGGGMKTLKIPLPLTPTVTAIKVVSTGEPSAPAGTDNLQAVIEGRNLTHVNGVFFGTMPAEIVTVDPSGTTMYVNLPKGAPGKVKVLLKTDLVFRGRKVTNAADFGSLGRANFTYTPKPPDGPGRGESVDVELNLKAKKGGGGTAPE